MDACDLTAANAHVKLQHVSVSCLEFVEHLIEISKLAAQRH